MRVWALLVAGVAGVTLKASTEGISFSIKEKASAKQGKGLPGCDLDTYIRYKTVFCSGGADGLKTLKESYFNQLQADVKDFKKDANKELGYKKWMGDFVLNNSMTVCHKEIGAYAGGDSCNYEFKKDGEVISLPVFGTQ